MNDLKKNLLNLNIDKSWTVFIDRDGVINKQIIGDYVRTLEQFEFLPGVLQAISTLSRIFGRIFIVTNQRGVSRKLILENDLEKIHNYLLEKITDSGGKIDKIYVCTHSYEDNCSCRKPHTGLALKAQQDFPEIDFKKSIMIGDSPSDMEFGKNLRMVTVYINSNNNNFDSLLSFSKFITNLLPQINYLTDEQKFPA